MQVLRDTLNCSLPIEIIYNGPREMDDWAVNKFQVLSLLRNTWQAFTGGLASYQPSCLCSTIISLHGMYHLDLAALPTLDAVSSGVGVHRAHLQSAYGCHAELSQCLHGNFLGADMTLKTGSCTCRRPFKTCGASMLGPFLSPSTGGRLRSTRLRYRTRRCCCHPRLCTIKSCTCKLVCAWGLQALQTGAWWNVRCDGGRLFAGKGSCKGDSCNGRLCAQGVLRCVRHIL